MAGEIIVINRVNARTGKVKILDKLADDKAMVYYDDGQEPENEICLISELKVIGSVV